MSHAQPISISLPAGQPRHHKRLRTALLVLLLIGAVAAAAWWWTNRSPHGDAIRLVTWNLQWFPGKHPGATPEEAAIHMREVQDALKHLDTDIMCFQEVRSGEAIAELISVAPSHQIQVVSNFPKVFGHSQQLAITSPLEGLTVYSEPFVAHGPVDPPRGFACAAMDAGDGLLVLVYNLHLKSNLGDLDKNIAKREESARQLVEHVRWLEPKLRQQGWQKILLIVAGDMNTDPTDRDKFGTEKTFGLLTELGLESGMLDLPLRKRVNIPAEGRYPDACFDWILVRPVEGVKWRTEVLMPRGWTQ